jgi:hypothetical protein
MPSDADTRRDAILLTRRTLDKSLVAVAGAAAIAPKIEQGPPSEKTGIASGVCI